MLSASNRNPYQPPTEQGHGRREPKGTSANVLRRKRWDRLGRVVIVAALLYMMIYLPYFLLQAFRGANGATISPNAIVPAHLVGMLLSLAALAMTFRDLFLREFDDPNAKAKWAILILVTGGIGWLVYVFRHALKPRPPEV